LFRNDIFNTSHITDEKSLAGKRRFRFVGMKLILQGEGLLWGLKVGKQFFRGTSSATIYAVGHYWDMCI
jgi:hypothetical protein